MKRPILVQCAYELCLPDKPPHNCHAPSHMLHFIRKGKGTFNGAILSAGQGFLARYGTLVHYYPDPDDPWEYAWINFYDKEILETLEHLIAFDERYTFSFDMAKPYFDMIAEAYERRARVTYTYDITYARTALFYELIGLFAEDSHRKGSSGVYASARRKHVDRGKAVNRKQLLPHRFQYADACGRVAPKPGVFTQHIFGIRTRVAKALFGHHADDPCTSFFGGCGYADPFCGKLGRL